MRRSPAVVDRKAIAEHAWRGRDRPARLERDRRPDEPAPGQAAERRHPDRHGPRRRLPAGGGVTAAAARRPSVRSAARSGSPSRRPRSSASPTSSSPSPSWRSSTQRLTAQIDRRLADIARPHARTSRPAPEHGVRRAARRPTRFGAPLLVWTVRADGDGRARTTTDADLPGGLRDVDQPDDGRRSATTQIRIDGPADRRPATSSSASRPRAGRPRPRTTIILAELLIAPILLVIVFLGAVAIGRRVAAPIEQARVSASWSSPPTPRTSCGRRCR